ncbi:hypothetical protein Gotur_034011 [Gossypium turneri]
MMESGGNDGFGGDKVSLLAEELIQLPVKSSMVEPNDKPTPICTIWTKKSYNPDSFKAQMENLETVMEGQPWLFRKKLVIFDRLTKPMERDQIRIKLNVQKPLRRGIFVSIGNGNRVWIPFNYETLPTFCFGCERLGHGNVLT